MPTSTSLAWGVPTAEELRAYELLKPRLAKLWDEVFPSDDEHYTCVVIPSITVGEDVLARHPGALFYEETLLFLLIRLRNPRAHVVYVTSQPIPRPVLDYYLHFLAGIPASHARSRLTVVTAYDGSIRPLAAKVLERPRLLAKIRAAIKDRQRAYLTVFRATCLEQRLAVALDMPLNAADPGTETHCTASETRRLMREVGIEVPLGFEDIRSRADIQDALRGLREQRPQLRRAVVKLNSSFLGEGHAVAHLPADTAVETVLDELQPSDGAPASDFLARIEHTGGVVEEVIEGPTYRAASTQVRISPRGNVSLSSSHDEIRGGEEGMDTAGCRFPAHEDYRSEIQTLGMKLGRALAERGVVSRISTEFIIVGEPGRLRILGSEINLGLGGSTHPLLVIRFLCGGRIDPHTGLFLSPTGRPKYYRASDRIEAPAYRGLSPEDLVEILTLNQLNYSPHTERGALFYMLGAISELGRVGMVAVGNTREEAEATHRQTIEVLDRESGRI